MGHAQKCITDTQTLLIIKLGGWKNTMAFHKSSKTNRHQVLWHLRQYWCYGNRSVIGKRRGRWTFRNWGDKGGKLPRRTSRRNTTLRREAITSAVLIRKRGNRPNGSVSPWGSKSNKSCRSTASMDCLLLESSNSRSALPTDSHTSPPPSLTSGGNDQLVPNTADLRVDHHLWG